MCRRVTRLGCVILGSLVRWLDAIKLNLAQLSSNKVVLLLVFPCLESNLDVLVGLDTDKLILILVFELDTAGPQRQPAVSMQLGVNAIF